MTNRLEHNTEMAIFNSRWLLAPFYLGLIVSLLILLIKFMQELFHLIPHVLTLTDSEVIVVILRLVDMSLIGGLLLMIVFSGYEIFVSKINIDGHEDQPDWMGKVDFSSLKRKVIGTIIAISAIELLKTVVNLSSAPTDAEETVLMWKVIVHATFVISGIGGAVMDKIATNINTH